MSSKQPKDFKCFLFSNVGLFAYKSWGFVCVCMCVCLFKEDEFTFKYTALYVMAGQ